MTESELVGSLPQDLAELAQSIEPSPNLMRRIRTKRMRRDRRRRLGVVGVGVVTVAVGVSVSLAAVGSGVTRHQQVNVFAAASTTTSSLPPGAAAVMPPNAKQPDQQNTMGPQVPESAVLSVALKAQAGTVTRSAIRTVSYGDLDAQLRAIGISFDSGSWTPVPSADPVDVVILAGSVVPVGAGNTVNWVIELYNPATGQYFAGGGSNDGTWPAFWDALSDQG